MKIKQIFFSLLLILTFSAVMLVTAENEVLSFSLDEALKRALEADIDAIFADRDINDLEELLADAVETAEETNVLAGTPQTQLQSKVKKNIDPLRAELNLDIAQREETERLQQREQDVISAYWQVGLSQSKLEKDKLTLEIAKNEYDAAMIKFNKGSISGAEILSKKYNYESAQLQVLGTEHTLQKAKFELNELLGQPLDSLVHVVENVGLQVSENWSFDCEEVYRKALAADENIIRLENELLFAEMKLQYAGEEFREERDEYLDVRAEKEKAKWSLESAKNNLYISIATAGNNILSGLENYKVLLYRLDIVKMDYESARIKFEQGEISKAEFLQAKLAVLESEISLVTATISLNNNYHNFNLRFLFIS